MVWESVDGLNEVLNFQNNQFNIGISISLLERHKCNDFIHRLSNTYNLILEIKANLALLILDSYIRILKLVKINYFYVKNIFIVDLVVLIMEKKYICIHTYIYI